VYSSAHICKRRQAPSAVALLTIPRSDFQLIRLRLELSFVVLRLAGLNRCWFDRRNDVRSYTFWVAIGLLFLTAFVGMLQSIEGALQVYKAYHLAYKQHSIYIQRKEGIIPITSLCKTPSPLTHSSIISRSTNIKHTTVGIR
jgi:hypothetical protein